MFLVLSVKMYLLSPKQSSSISFEQSHIVRKRFAIRKSLNVDVSPCVWVKNVSSISGTKSCSEQAGIPHLSLDNPIEHLALDNVLYNFVNSGDWRDCKVRQNDKKNQITKRAIND